MYRLPYSLYRALDGYPLNLVCRNSDVIFPLSQSNRIHDNRLRCTIFLLRLRKVWIYNIEDPKYRREHREISASKFTDLLLGVGDSDIQQYSDYLISQIGVDGIGKVFTYVLMTFEGVDLSEYHKVAKLAESVENNMSTHEDNIKDISRNSVVDMIQYLGIITDASPTRGCILS